MMWKFQNILLFTSVVFISNQVQADVGAIVKDTTCSCLSLKCPANQAPVDGTCGGTGSGSSGGTLGCISTTFAGSMLRCPPSLIPVNTQCVDVKSAPSIPACSDGVPPEVAGSTITTSDGRTELTCDRDFAPKDLTCSSGSTTGKACISKDKQFINSICPKGLAPNDLSCIIGDKGADGASC